MFLVSRVLRRTLNDASNSFQNTETFPNFGRGSDQKCTIYIIIYKLGFFVVFPGFLSVISHI